MFRISLFLLAILDLGFFFGTNRLEAKQPNIVWIVSEDNSIHYLRHFFPGGAATPNIEALAEAGLTFDHAYSNAPVCSVARTTLATGCYGPRIGTQFHRRYQLAPMPPGLKMFPGLLRDAGYYTTNNSKKDYNAIEGEGVWDQSSGKASWRNRSNPSQPFFHMQSHGQSHEGSLHFNEDTFHVTLEKFLPSGRWLVSLTDKTGKSINDLFAPSSADTSSVLSSSSSLSSVGISNAWLPLLKNLLCEKWRPNFNIESIGNFD